MTANADLVWADLSGFLVSEVSDAVWNSTFKEIRPVELTDDVLILSSPSQLLRTRIETRYSQLMEEALEETGHAGLRFRFEVNVDVDTPGRSAEPSHVDRSQYPLSEQSGSSTERNDQRENTERSVDLTAAVPRSAAMNRAGSTEPQGPLGSIDSRYTFETFVIGPTNRFTQAASLAVAENPGRSYNPLFIYGPAGLGKTHILLAIANYVREVYPSYRIRYISSETMLNEFVESIRESSQGDFKRRFRGIDVLLVDDIQFIEGKEALQEEFFHTFNSLQQAEKQIVLSSDRPPDAIKTLEDRMRSRFKQGLITDIQPPDFETRLAILQKKQQHSGADIPDTILEFIATHISYNIRELEGALTKICAYTTLNNVPPTLTLAEDLLADSISSTKPRQITASLIVEKAAEFFSLNVDQIRGKSRTRDLVHARQVAMYVCRLETELSFPQIGREFGGRDHTTVMHAFDKISSHMGERQRTYDDVIALTQMVIARD